MKRKKRFTIRLVALGLAVTALSAAPAQARIDEGYTGLQAPYVESLRTADDVRHPTVVQSRPSVVASDDGFEWGTIGISGMLLVLGASGMYLIVQQSNRRRLASA